MESSHLEHTPFLSLIRVKHARTKPTMGINSVREKGVSKALVVDECR